MSREFSNQTEALRALKRLGFRDYLGEFEVAGKRCHVYAPHEPEFDERVILFAHNGKWTVALAEEFRA